MKKALAFLVLFAVVSGVGMAGFADSSSVTVNKPTVASIKGKRPANMTKEEKILWKKEAAKEAKTKAAKN